MAVFRNTNNYSTEEDYIISIMEGVAGNDEGIVESIDELKDIIFSYTVNETELGLLEIDSAKAKYTHYSTKRGKTDEFVINRAPKRNLIHN
jgi:hypothetical protein